MPDLAGAKDLAAARDLTVNLEGPEIDILEPKPDKLATEATITVRAKVDDPDGVNVATVLVTPEGGEPRQMTIESVGIYKASVDLSAFGESVRLYVSAADLNGNENTKALEFQRDPGPSILINAPGEGSRHKGSVSLQITVRDRYSVTSFAARIGSVPIDLEKTDLGQGQMRYAGTITFDDEAFKPPLSGEQLIFVSAVNQNGVRATAARKFFVDDEGPTITVANQAPGDLIGGIIQVQLTADDPAGVEPKTVTCVIGNDLDKRKVELKSADGKTFTGQFDTRTLTQFDLWPVMSFRAADTLGNESHYEFVVGLDNGPPMLELDPSDKVRMGAEEVVEGEKVLRCSHAFDPVGPDAANDLEMVPQVMFFRMRLEDHGNHVPSAPWVPISAIDPASVRAFFLDDTTKALVVDTTGDGYCDSINSEVVPLGTAPSLGQAVAVNYIPIPPGGEPDYTPVVSGDESFPDPFGGCSNGEAEEAPEALCPPKTCIADDVCEQERMSFVMSNYRQQGGGATIYTIPPVKGPPDFACTGLPFDFLANNFEDGWVCVAGEAADNLGNGSVSPPLRVWVNKAAGGRGALPGNAGSPPACTGTLLPGESTADTSKPCKFRGWNEMFPQRYAPYELIVQK